MLDIRSQTYVYNLDLYPMLFRQLFGFSSTSPEVMQLRLSIYIFYFLGGSAKNVTLALSINAIHKEILYKLDICGGSEIRLIHLDPPLSILDPLPSAITGPNSALILFKFCSWILEYIGFN